MPRFVRPLLLALVLGACAVIPNLTTAASAPTYIYGDLTLFGEPIKSSAKLIAMVGTTACGTGDVKGGTYSVVVQSNCGTAGTNIQFKLQFSAPKGGAAQDAYWSSTTALPPPGQGEPQKHDLQFPAWTMETVTPVNGCVDLVSAFANKTSVTTIAGLLNEEATVTSIWKLDTKKDVWMGYIPGDGEEPMLATLKDVNRGDTYTACFDTATPVSAVRQPTAP